ncbi:MAG: rhodanese-related sulfurtransferase [Gammaproteobacteria bacterium]|nr:rhodanese-related sulfurtransferase [Gammaproteobacteria bacterium]
MRSTIRSSWPLRSARWPTQTRCAGRAGCSRRHQRHTGGGTFHLEAFRHAIGRDSRLRDLPSRFSSANASNPVFHRLKVKVKDEIVALHQGDVDVSRTAGMHVNAAQWNALLADEDVLVIDTRNDYEVAVGSFPGAVNPQTKSFREFPAWVERNLDPGRDRRIAMFCTGGIRCEKASAYLRQCGFDEVYQLEGGVLNYLETVGADDRFPNRFLGECFVFDQRVAVTDDLAQGEFVSCRACRTPLDASAMADDAYVEGISCPHCAQSVSDARRAGFAERIRQERLAASRGTRHVGARMNDQPGSGR